MSKRKKSHGGRKFIAFLVIVGALITLIKVGGKTELGQRISGNREDRRLERTTVMPRFAYTAATLRVTEGSMYNEGGVAVDLTTTNDISIDRPSATAATEVNIVRTSTEPQSVSTTPSDVRAAYKEVLTKAYRYESPADEGQPWFRWVADQQFYGTPLDLYYIPMIDDIMGFELRDTPSLPISNDPAPEVKPATAETAGAPAVPSAVTTLRSYELDLATFNRAVPILASRAGFAVPLETAVTLTIGFDDVGLLRFVDISIPNAAATTQAQLLGAGRAAVYHYMIEVTDISGEPIAIEVPSKVVDASSDTLSAAIP